MGWSIGTGTDGRDIGYGVPAECDHPQCKEQIDRGLGYVCGAEPHGGDTGCGLFFCGSHLSASGQLCERCRKGKEPFEPKPDVAEWNTHKMTDESWQQWRDENPAEVAKIRASLASAPVQS